MLSRVLIFCLLALAALPSLAHAAGREARPAADAILYAQPFTGADQVGVAEAGRFYRVLDEAVNSEGARFYKVTTPDARGWMSAKGTTVRTVRTPRASSAYRKAATCKASKSRSIGGPSSGRLLGGVRFPASSPKGDWFSWSFREQRVGGKAHQWGHCSMVRKVMRAITRYRAKHPSAPPVAVGDLSRRRGGEIDHHATHENGRQIDLYLPRKDGKRMEPHTVSQVDQALSRALLREVLRAGAKKCLTGVNTRAIRTSSRVSRYPNHDDHFHCQF